MKIAILGKRQTWYTVALQTAFKARGIEADCLPVTRLVSAVGLNPRLRTTIGSLEDYQVVIVRAIPAGSLEQIIYRMDTLHRLENAGVKVLNPPIAIERGVDKYFTLTLMEEAGLPVPKTIVSEQFDDAMAAFEKLGEDVVVKPLFGSEGRGMIRVSDRDTAYRVFRALELSRYIYYQQTYIPHGNEDIRVFIVGDRAVAAMTRRGETWKSNISNGGKGEPFRLDKSLSDMSVRAVKAVGAEYAGVDILPIAGGGYSFIEVNTIPGWKGLVKATGFDVAGHLADYVLKRI
jgi:RimK family alpha-L-glutamate ligase